ncbi:uncharacterized protein BYT42DRAFT_414609 [Radiomyces spectabilis]|uniref:uncharacterized protein n=1 Tax=Radiomyces spectabilis TaxID=64574 RepID=UPI002220C498|nr:uncharacterized protein BYT42DRAFT_414609 [Radiomyces spectabilis]KAI8374648.1 hypothetical protein BYT42DRAFT_414609 [Radiomyces spectabilis]
MLARRILLLLSQLFRLRIFEASGSYREATRHGLHQRHNSGTRGGFSKQMIAFLNDRHIKYSYFNTLSDDEVKQGPKTHVNWPTYPILFYNGELLGGLNIVKRDGKKKKDDSMIISEHALAKRVSM